jgi:hypothetical protein
MSSEAPLCLLQEEEHSEYQECEHNEPLGAWKGQRHSPREMSPSVFKERPCFVNMMLVRWIARAVGSNSGLTIQLRHDQGGRVLISISNSAVGAAAGERTKNLHGQLRQREIQLCVMAPSG